MRRRRPKAIAVLFVQPHQQAVIVRIAVTVARDQELQDTADTVAATGGAPRSGNSVCLT